MMTSQSVENKPGRSFPSVADAAIPAFFAPAAAHEDESGEYVLAEVDFKWLMAGEGWWIDSTRFHSDATYAARFLTSALYSSSNVLRECAESLQRKLVVSGAVSAVTLNFPPLP